MTRMLLVSLAVLSIAIISPAQSLDAVDNLRQHLRAQARSLTERERDLKRCATALRTIGELRRALLLQEWRDLDPDEKVAAVDQPIRAGVEQRFVQAARSVLRQGDESGSIAIAEMLSEMGATTRSTSHRHGLAHVLAPDLSALLANGSPMVRQAATRALGRINPDPEAASVGLNMLLDSSDVTERIAAVEALLSMMKVAGHLMGQAANLKGIEVTRADIIRVGRITVASSARVAKDTDPRVRSLSLEAVRMASAVLFALVRDTFAAEGDIDSGLRMRLLQEQAELLPLLRALENRGADIAVALEDESPDVRQLARRTLEDLALLHRQMLQRRLVQQQPSELTTAPVTLRSVEDPLVEGIYPSLKVIAANLSDPEVKVRRTAVELIETLGPIGAPAGRVLIKAMADKDASVRWTSVRALGKLGPIDGNAGVLELSNLLADADLGVALAAAASLRRFGTTAKDAVPALLKAAASKDVDMRVAALRALEMVGRGDGTLGSTYGKALADEDARVRQAAAEVVGESAVLGPQLKDELRKVLNDPEPEVRKAASDALANLAQKTKP